MTKIVYSSDPDWKPDEEPKEPVPTGAPSPGSQNALDVAIEKRQKGKVVTLVKGFRCHPAGLEIIAKKLKTTVGAGGTVKDGVIEVQGEHREKVAAALEKMGYRIRKR